MTTGQNGLETAFAPLLKRKDINLLMTFGFKNVVMIFQGPHWIIFSMVDMTRKFQQSVKSLGH